LRTTGIEEGDLPDFLVNMTKDFGRFRTFVDFRSICPESDGTPLAFTATRRNQRSLRDRVSGDEE